MKIVERYPPQFNTTVEFELTGDSVIQRWSSWRSRGQDEYRFDVMSPATANVWQSERAWGSYAFFFVICAMLAQFTRFLWSWEVEALLFLGFMLFAGVCGLLSLRKSYEFEFFKNKSGNVLFGIRKGLSTEGDDFIAELKKRIT